GGIGVRATPATPPLPARCQPRDVKPQENRHPAPPAAVAVSHLRGYMQSSAPPESPYASHAARLARGRCRRLHHPRHPAGGGHVRCDLIRFHKIGDHGELWVVNPYATATPNTPMARTVAYSFGHSIAQSFPIASVRDTTNEVLVDLAPFFVSDWADVGAFF